MVIRYVRDKKPTIVRFKDKNGQDKTRVVERGKPIGIVIGITPDQILWSKCNPKDRWSRQAAIEAAVLREHRNPNQPYTIPSKVVKVIEKVREELSSPTTFTMDFGRALNPEHIDESEA